MISKVKHFFDRFIGTDSVVREESPHGVQVAAAALLVETMRADFDESPEEEEKILDILRRELKLSAEESKQLFDLAVTQLDDAACLHEFTRLINQSFPMDKRVMIVEMLWRVALIDRNIDKYEEHVIRKIADLLYVRHKEFIKAKHRAVEHSPGS